MRQVWRASALERERQRGLRRVPGNVRGGSWGTASLRRPARRARRACQREGEGLGLRPRARGRRHELHASRNSRTRQAQELSHAAQRRLTAATLGTGVRAEQRDRGAVVADPGRRGRRPLGRRRRARRAPPPAEPPRRARSRHGVDRVGGALSSPAPHWTAVALAVARAQQVSADAALHEVGSAAAVDGVSPSSPGAAGSRCRGYRRRHAARP